MPDDYGSVGPDKPGYAEDVRDIGLFLNGGRAVNVKFAARSTMHHVVLCLLSQVASATGALPAGFPDRQALFVGIDGGLAAWFPMNAAPIYHGYIMSYMGRPFGDDDTDHPFADFINAVIREVTR